MRRNRSLYFPVVLGLVSATMLVVQPAQPVRAAITTYYVDNALDGDLTDNPSACNDNTPDNKNCSLRQALERARADNTDSSIEFIIPSDSSDPDFGYSNGTWTIQPQGPPLPVIDTPNTKITGKTNLVGQPGIVIDGTSVSDTNAIGLEIRSSGNIIDRLVIVNFKGSDSTKGVGILITGSGATGNTIRGSYIGSKPFSTTALSNSAAGVRISGASNNTIGASGTDGRNYISGNGTNGISLQNASKNTLINNYVGVVLSSSSALTPVGNTGSGIQLDNSSENVIGGSSSSNSNIISGNGLDGIQLTSSQTYSNTLSGNLIGTNELGTITVNGLPVPSLGNGRDGIRLTAGANRNTINGTSSARTVISANKGYGILLTDRDTSNNRITGAYIGVTLGGDTGIGNTFGGIRIQNDASNNVIGTGVAGEGNLISGNTGFGISLARTSSAYKSLTATTIMNNRIGLRSNETSAIPNALGGISIDSGAVSTQIGGAAAGEGNVISGNTGAGIVITGTQTLSTTVSGNIIGLKRAIPGGAYTKVEANTDGILIGSNVVFPVNQVPLLGVHFTQIGGSTAGSNNTIAGNKGNGIHIVGTGVVTTTITGNTIGGILDAQNQIVAATGNAGNGVLVEQGPRVTNIRSSTIYSNTLNGVLVASGAQRVSVLDSKFTRNGGKAIALTPSTADANGIASNPNHDINPPFNLRLNQARQVTGQVLVDPTRAASCITCTLQFFAADPKLLDSQGRDQLVLTSVKADTTGYFTATLSTVPAQLVVNATDNDGNSSEFATLTVTPKLAISNYGPTAKFASPTESISYTFRVTNTGTLDLTDIQLKATSSKNWTIDVAPKTLSLKAANGTLPAEGKPVTVTLTLPIGTDARVIAGTIDTAIVTATSALTATATASAQAQTTVRSAFVLRVEPPARNGQGVSTDEDNLDVVLYQHALSNTGNLTGTVTLTATTDINQFSPNDYKTTLDQTQVTLAPGQTKTVTVRVEVPISATAGDIAKTTLKVTQIDPLPQQTLFFTDTTTVAASRRATISPNRVGDAGAAETIKFEHTVINFGNEQQATFKLTGGSSLGSTVSFEGISGPLGSGNTFTVGNQEGNSSFRFYVVVTVDRRAMRGDTDTVTVTLSDANDVVVGGVQDIINVTRNAIIPRMYLPQAFRS